MPHLRTSLLPALMALTPLIGCKTVENHFEDSLPAAGVYLVTANHDDGRLSYTGRSLERFDLVGRSWGSASDEGRAAEREASNSWEFGVEGDALWLNTHSPDSRSGVDFDITGPAVIDLDLISEDGRVSVDGVEGWVVITASSVDADQLIGNADLYANTGDVDAEVFPWDQGEVRVETESGDIELALPWGLDYDLQVWGDLDYELIVEDLGWDVVATDAAYFAGVRGYGDIAVNVYARGGDVHIKELR